MRRLFSLLLPILLVSPLVDGAPKVSEKRAESVSTQTELLRHLPPGSYFLGKSGKEDQTTYLFTVPFPFSRTKEWLGRGKVQFVNKKKERKSNLPDQREIHLPKGYQQSSGRLGGEWWVEIMSDRFDPGEEKWIPKTTVIFRKRPAKEVLNLKRQARKARSVSGILFDHFKTGNFLHHGKGSIGGFPERLI